MPRLIHAFSQNRIPAIIAVPITLTTPHFESIKQQSKAKIQNPNIYWSKLGSNLFLYLVCIPLPEKKILITILDMQCVNWILIFFNALKDQNMRQIFAWRWLEQIGWINTPMSEVLSLYINIFMNYLLVTSPCKQALFIYFIYRWFVLLQVNMMKLGHGRHFLLHAGLFWALWNVTLKMWW